MVEVNRLIQIDQLVQQHRIGRIDQLVFALSDEPSQSADMTSDTVLETSARRRYDTLCS